MFVCYIFTAKPIITKFGRVEEQSRGEKFVKTQFADLQESSYKLFVT